MVLNPEFTRLIFLVDYHNYLIRFFVLIRGAFTPPPSILAPVMKIPLKQNEK